MRFLFGSFSALDVHFPLELILNLLQSRKLLELGHVYHAANLLYNCFPLYVIKIPMCITKHVLKNLHVIYYCINLNFGAFLHTVKIPHTKNLDTPVPSIAS